jgi:hypothetical protein
VPALFIVAAGILLYYTLADPDNRQNSFAGTLIILAGVPVYLYFARKKRANEITH